MRIASWRSLPSCWRRRRARPAIIGPASCTSATSSRRFASAAPPPPTPAAAAALRAPRPVDQAVIAAIRTGIPFLGICLGMQLLFESSAEDGAACLAVLPGTVGRLPTREKLPHVGWNTLEHVRPHPVLQGMEGQAFYFVHTYVVVPRHPTLAAGETTHGVPFVSAVARQGLVGVQFHPERSGTAGLRLLENFLRFANVEAAA